MGIKMMLSTIKSVHFIHENNQSEKLCFEIRNYADKGLPSCQMVKMDRLQKSIHLNLPKLENTLEQEALWTTYLTRALGASTQ